jgi:hypothetical protein
MKADAIKAKVVNECWSPSGKFTGHTPTLDALVALYEEVDDCELLLLETSNRYGMNDLRGILKCLDAVTALLDTKGERL